MHDKFLTVVTRTHVPIRSTQTSSEAKQKLMAHILNRKSKHELVKSL